MGDLTIHKIVELEAAYNAIDNFLPDLGPDRLQENLAWFSSDGFVADSGKLLLSYHSFLLETPNNVVLIDSCIGNGKTCVIRNDWHGRTDTRWLDELAATGLSPEDVDYVICSHLHVDHVGWNTLNVNGQWIPTFPNARYVFVDKEYEAARASAALSAPGSILQELAKRVFEESIYPVIAARQVDLVAATHELDGHIRLLPTHGHTPGHVAICAGQGRDLAVFTGDLIHSPIQLRYPQVLTATDDIPSQSADSRRRFLERYVDSETLVCTMHFPDPSVGRLLRWGDGYRLEYVDPCRSC